MCQVSTNGILYTQVEDSESVQGDATKKNIFKGRDGEKEVVPNDPIDIQRQEKVKEAMIHAWSSYEKYAWGQDELQV